MIKKIIYLLILAISSPILAQDYIWDETQFIQPNYSGISTIARMDISNTDEKVILGFFKNTLEIEGQSGHSEKPIGVFIAKYNANNEFLWLKKVAEAEELTPETFIPIIGTTPSIKIDDFGNIYIGLNYNATLIDSSIPLVFEEDCSFCSDIIIIKIDSDGNHITNFTIDNSCVTTIPFDGMVVDQQQNLYLSIHAHNSPYVIEPTEMCECIVGNDTINVQENNSIVLKFSPNGTGLWGVSYVGTSKIIELKNEYIYVSGATSKPSILFDDFTLTFPNIVDYGGYITKFDTSDVFYWAKYFGVNGWDSNLQILDVHAVSDNDILVMGRSFTQSVPNRLYLQDAPTLIGTPSGSQDAFVVCYDSLGNVKWSDIIISTANDWFFNAVSDADKNTFIGGTFSSSQLELDQDTLTSYGSYETFITAYDSMGNHLWAKSAGGMGSDMTKGLKMDSQENLYLLGSTTSQPIHFDDHTYYLTGNTAQIFMSKLVPNTIGMAEQDTLSYTHIYPNPNTGIFKLKSQEAFRRLEIYNLLGKQVYSKNFNSPLKEVNINTALRTGVYFVVLQTAQDTYSVRKMVIN